MNKNLDDQCSLPRSINQWYIIHLNESPKADQDPFNCPYPTPPIPVVHPSQSQPKPNRTEEIEMRVSLFSERRIKDLVLSYCSPAASLRSSPLLPETFLRSGESKLITTDWGIVLYRSLGTDWAGSHRHSTPVVPVTPAVGGLCDHSEDTNCGAILGTNSERDKNVGVGDIVDGKMRISNGTAFALKSVSE